MLKCRMLCDRISRSAVQLAPEDTDLARGNEAIMAGATLELGSQDTVVTSSCRFGVWSTKGTPISAVTGEDGNHFGAPNAGPGPVSSLDPFNLGTGIALSHHLDKARNVVVALATDRSAPPDRWKEAMKIAGVYKLPIIYVLRCGSIFDTGSATKAPDLKEISLMTKGCGFPGVIVDGNDAVAVWRVTQESIHRARSRGGPTLILCETRCTQLGDPLAHLEHYMSKRGVWDDRWRQEATDKVEADFDAALTLD